MDELCTHVFKEAGIVISGNSDLLITIRTTTKFFNKCFYVTGGVGSNKVIAKVACSLHKPAAVTALTRRGFYRKSNKIAFRTVSGFGGELGQSLQNLFGDLNLKQLRKAVRLEFELISVYLGDEEKAEKASNLVFGICHNPVENKLMSNRSNCGKGGLSKFN